MKTKLTILTLVCAIGLVLTVTALACGRGEDEGTAVLVEPASAVVSRDRPGLPGPPGSPEISAWAMSDGAPGDRAETEVIEREVVKEVVAQAPGAAAPRPAPAPTAAPAPAAWVKQTESGASALTGSDASTQIQAQLVSQRRIIIRTVNMEIVVAEIQSAIDDISELADSIGGWVVSTDRRQKHTGSVSIRVPAEELDSVVETLRSIAEDVESEDSSSQDVTDEYFDLHSRLKNQQATEAALIRLLDRAASVEHALAVQRELSNIQENVERLLGRIKLLEETSAYSLITVNLRLAPVDIAIDAGPDQSVAAYTPIRFKATFRPPEGMDSHSITWDFGDGSEPVVTGRTAPTTEDGERVTATVTHEYGDPKDSPFIAQVSISSYGESGAGEGEDTLIVTVSETPVIEVFAGERDYRVLQNELVEFSGSFTRPSGLSDVRYRWDFGDGSEPEEGEVAEGITRVDTTHTYTDHRPTPYRVRFTISADSEVGEIVSSHEIRVRVDEDPGLIVGGFDVGDTSKTAVRTLSLVVSGLTTAAIWVGIFSVIWVPLAIVVVILVRRGRRFRTERPPSDPRPPMLQDEPGPGLG